MLKQNELLNNLIVSVYAGSRAYGTSLPTSDVDVRGIFVAPAVSVRTPFFNIEQFTPTNIDKNADVVYYELNKFIKLAVDQNPNIIEILHTDGSDIIVSSPAFELLRQERGNLLTSKIAQTTTGYAFSQLTRLKNSKRNVDSLEPLQQLCKLLQCALKEKLIDVQFIERNCGSDVVNFMEENDMIA